MSILIPSALSMADINEAQDQMEAGDATVSTITVSLAPIVAENVSGGMPQQHKPSSSATSEEHEAAPAASPSGDAFERLSTAPTVSDLHTSTPAPPVLSKNELHLRHWKWELAACVLVLAIAAAMVATMYPHGNQPIPKWPFKTTINAILSIYSVAFKAAINFVVVSSVGQLQWTWFSSSHSRLLSDVIAYNDAGHSLWGSIVLLWRQRMRQPLVVMATLIMIGNVVIDPFIQQFIQPFDCSMPLDHSNATLPRTNAIDEYFNTGESGRVPPEVIWSALGTSTSGTPGIELPSTCSTGNCTFPDSYDTLGICSACEDISDKVVINSATVIGNDSGHYDKCSTQRITSHILSGDSGHYWSSKSDRLSTTFSDGCSMDYHTEIAKMDIWAPKPSDPFAVRIDTLVGKTTFSAARKLISTGASITGCGYQNTHHTWACRGYGAAACTLKPCIRTYSASIDSGRLTEHRVSQSADIKWGLYEKYYGILDSHCLSAEEWAFLTARGYTIDDTRRWVRFEGDLSGADLGFEHGYSEDWLNGMRSLLDDKCLYLVDIHLINKISYGTWAGPFIHNPAASNVVGAVRGLQKSFTESNKQTVIDTFNGPQLLQVMYNYGSVEFARIDEIFANISEALTTFIRTHGNETYSAPVVGQVQHYAICLGVQWPWITMPAVLAASTIAFLFLVIESTRRVRMPIWKASLLPWVLGGALEGNSIDSAILVDEPSDAVSRAQGLHTYAAMSVLEERSKSIVVNIYRKPERNIAMYNLQEHSPRALQNTRQR